MKTLLALIAGMLLSVPARFVSAALVMNGDFESLPNFFANPDSPQTHGSWTFENFAGVEGTGGNPGKKVRLESNGLATSDPTIAQVVSGLAVGTTYTLEWDLGRRVSLQSGTGRSFGVFLDTQTFANSLFLSEHLLTSYVHQSVNFTATATSHKIIFAGELDARTNGLPNTDTDVSYNLDNVTLTSSQVAAVPEPGTLSMMAISFTCLFGVRRFRQMMISQFS
jgi:hypothetical protein